MSKRGYPRLVRLGAFVSDEQSAALWVMESGLDGDPSATATRADDAIDDVSYCERGARIWVSIKAQSRAKPPQSQKNKL